MSEGRQTVAGAYLKMAAHEELCAERYRGINEKLSWVLRSLVGMLLALLAWALVQLYALEPLRRERPHAKVGQARAYQLAKQFSENGELVRGTGVEIQALTSSPADAGVRAR